MTTKKAFIQVSNTTNLHKLAPFLIDNGFEIVSSNYKYLKQHNIKATNIGLEQHERLISGELDFDVVVIDLNDIEAEISKVDASLDSILSNIAPYTSLLMQLSARQYKHTIILPTISDYDEFMVVYSKSQDIPIYHRLKLAQKVFALQAKYNDIISRYLYTHASKMILDQRNG